MRPSFNTAGPCIPGDHYMLPPERRLGRVLELIEDRKYFTLHAGHQTGKTTSVMWLERHLNETGRYRAVWVDIQVAREKLDPLVVFSTILECIDHALKWPDWGQHRPAAADIEALLQQPTTALFNYLSRLSELDARPLVVFFDEADGLVGEPMVSFLTQLRKGYIDRQRSPFPATVALVGRRQVRDYVLTAEQRQAISWLGTSSPFNIAAEAATLGPFTYDEVTELLAQHTAQTGQRFEPEAAQRIHELGQGHPWLTNALADRIVDVDLRDRSLPVTAEHVEAAKETLIVERRSHIDSLVARLREPRVRRILEPMLVGDRPQTDMLDDDLNYVVGLGLVTMQGGFAAIANPIYREVIPRALTYAQQVTIPDESIWYMRSDGSLNMPKLMTAWQVFWRKDGHLAAEGFGYREAGPHLMLMAFLQRIVNSGGRIEREYGLGRGALDLVILWREWRHAIEMKLRRDTETEEEAFDQLARYLDHLGLSEGWLVLFDLRKTLSWAEKLTLRDVDHAGKQIHVVGC